VKNKLVLITGGSSGVGKAAALGLAGMGARTVLLSRERRRAEQARRQLVELSGNEDIDLLPADLTDFAAVRRAARLFRQRYERLDVLMNCAGVLFPRRTAGVEGVEMTLAVELLGHFLLTNLLLELLRRSAPARILTVTGNAAPLRFARIHFHDLGLQRAYNPLKAKLQAELAKILFAWELARRLEGSGVTSNAFHPGLIRSRLTRNFPWYLRLPADLATALFAGNTRTGVYLASSPEVEGVSGRFFEGVGKERKVPLEPEQALRLWEIAESLTGLQPGEQ
jgi:NAD(P)-dependent dehydrogenase (short-subunit alcohol dehydrogenase family)